MRAHVLLGAWLMLAAAPTAATPPPIVSPGRAPPGAPPPAPPDPPPPDKNDINGQLAAALPADGDADVVLIDWPAVAGTPHVRGATAVAASPAAIRSVLLDAANYRKLIPSLLRADVSRTADGLPAVGWEVEVPLFNLKGTLVIHERSDGAEVDLTAGDFSPGKLTFKAIQRAAGGSTLLMDARLDIQNGGWLVRRLVKLSHAGEPAALVAASYVTLRAVALRAENAGSGRARRPSAPPAPPPGWTPNARVLADGQLVALRAHGAVALVGRTRSQRLAGVAVATRLSVPAPSALGRLRDPESWHAFPGWRTIRPRAGPDGIGAEVEDNLPFVDLEATWTAQPGEALRWTATKGVITGARLGWEVYPLDPRVNGGAPALMALLMYPRLETTGRLARKAIASEPLLEHGLALAVALADLTAMKTALETHPR